MWPVQIERVHAPVRHRRAGLWLTYLVVTAIVLAVGAGATYAVGSKFTLVNDLAQPLLVRTCAGGAYRVVPGETLQLSGKAVGSPCGTASIVGEGATLCVYPAPIDTRSNLRASDLMRTNSNSCAGAPG